MLTISVEKKSAPTTPSLQSDFTKVVLIGASTVLISGKSPYGFVAEHGDFVIAGESTGSPDDRYIMELLTGLAGSSDNQHLGFRCSLAVVVDKIHKCIRIYNSVKSCRPYYIYNRQQGFVLSSSLLAMKECGVPLALNETALPEIMVYRYANAPNSPVRAVRLLPGGERLEFNLDTGQFDKRECYQFPSEKENSRYSIDAAADLLEESLESNVRESLEAAQSPGILLSGGLDSSVLAALAAKNGYRPASASSSFSFANKADAESHYALTVAEHLGLDHRVFEGNKEMYLRGLVEAVYHAESPLHHLQSVMLYLLFRDLAREGHDLLLNGESADCILGLDAHVIVYKFLKLNKVLSVPPLRAAIRLASKAKPSDFYLRFFAHDFGESLDTDRHFLYSIGQYTNLNLVKELFGYELHQIVASHRELMRPYTGQEFLNQLSIVSFLCEGSMTMCVWSKLAEAFSIKMSYPFCGENVIDHIFPVPWDIKLAEPKVAVRKVLRNIGFKEEFITRPKQSFGFPVNFWAPRNALFQPLVDLASEMFDAALLKRLQREDRDYAMLLWNLLNIYLFDQLIIRGADQGSLADEVIARHRSLEGAKSK